MLFLSILIRSISSIETVSYLTSGSELYLSGHSGIQLTSSSISCYLGIFNSSYPFGVKCGENFPLFIDDTRRSHFGSEVLTEGELHFSSGLTIGGVDQWSLVVLDHFQETEASNWSNKSISDCGGTRMLGGYCQYSAGNSSTLLTLPEHSLVKVRLTWHFIDQWRGETAFLALGTASTNSTVWSQTYDIASAKSPLNICGNSEYGEGKFSMPVEVVIEHSSSELLVLLGSTLEEQPCEKSWGISALEVFIR